VKGLVLELALAKLLEQLVLEQLVLEQLALGRLALEQVKRLVL
jgi:hypothetical protein